MLQLQFDGPEPSIEQWEAGNLLTASFEGSYKHKAINALVHPFEEIAIWHELSAHRASDHSTAFPQSGQNCTKPLSTASSRTVQPHFLHSKIPCTVLTSSVASSHLVFHALMASCTLRFRGPVAPHEFNWYRAFYVRPARPNTVMDFAAMRLYQRSLLTATLTFTVNHRDRLLPPHRMSQRRCRPCMGRPLP